MIVGIIAPKANFAGFTPPGKNLDRIDCPAGFGAFAITAKYAVVAGAVTGGGLTVIANAPNPAGQSILSRFFPGGVNPAKLALGAIIPTIIMGFCYMAIPQDVKDPQKAKTVALEASK